MTPTLSSRLGANEGGRLQYADVGTLWNDELRVADGSANTTVAARVWQLLDHTHTTPGVVSRLRADVSLSAADSYALERAVAGVMEQLIATGRLLLVRRRSSGEAVVRIDVLPSADG